MIQAIENIGYGNLTLIIVALHVLGLVLTVAIKNAKRRKSNRLIRRSKRRGVKRRLTI